MRDGKFVCHLCGASERIEYCLEDGCVFYRGGSLWTVVLDGTQSIRWQGSDWCFELWLEIESSYLQYYRVS